MNLFLFSLPIHMQSILPPKKLLEAWSSPFTCPGSFEIWVLMLRMLAELKLKEALPCEPHLQAQWQPSYPRESMKEQNTPVLPWLWSLPVLSTWDWCLFPVTPPLTCLPWSCWTLTIFQWSASMRQNVCPLVSVGPLVWQWLNPTLKYEIEAHHA